MKFGWMGCVMYSGRPYTYRHFQNELKQAIKKNCLKQLNNIESNKKIREKKIKEVLSGLKLSKKDLYSFKQFRSWMHLRTFVKDMTSVGMEPTIPILDEIAKRAGVKYIDILYLSHSELKQIFSSKKKDLILESRARQEGWGMVLNHGSIKYYNHKSIRVIKEDDISVPAGVKGFPACPGIVKGNAIIVRTIEDLEQIKEGDILVTYMTTTNYVPFLSKVAAIITDEGGITCHAAIVSREMNIPCVVGTRIGTKSFKNGDIIEVNAKKGIIKKL